MIKEFGTILNLFSIEKLMTATPHKLLFLYEWKQLIECLVVDVYRPLRAPTQMF